MEVENNLSGESSILYVIYTDQSGMWRIQCVPLRPNSFENRQGLPEVGLTNMLSTSDLTETSYQLRPGED